MNIQQHLIHSAICLNNDFISLLAKGFVKTAPPSSCNIPESSNYILLYTQTGNGSLSSAGKTLPLSEDTLLFSDCQKPLILNASGPAWNFYLLFLSGNSVSSYYQYFSPRGPLYRVAPSSDIPAFLQRIHAFSSIDTAEKALIASKWLTDILTEICVVTMM